MVWGFGGRPPPPPPLARVLARTAGGRLLTSVSPQHLSIMPAPFALFLSRLESRDQVCTDQEHIGAPFADVLGEEVSQATLDTRVQMINAEPAVEHEKLNLGPNLSLFLLRQRIVLEMAAGGVVFAAATARCLVRAQSRAGASSLQELVEVMGLEAAAISAALRWEGLGS